jgi:S-adenosylmethionine:tRNA ribosyltransferase-isomerase
VNVSDFDFELPPELIAQHPSADRGQSRLLVLHRDNGQREHTTFSHLVDVLERGDLLVVNDTRVFPARLLGRRVPSGGVVECLLLRHVSTASSQDSTEARGLGPEAFHIWEALMHPGQKLRPGSRVVFEGAAASLHGEVVERHFYGRRTIRLWTDDPRGVRAVIEHLGHMPLPPYITRADAPSDRERYQTVYAREEGSVAAPTAGLHVTPALLDALDAKGIERAAITLHVGYGTFRPVRVDRVEDHEVDPEVFTVPADTAAALTRATREGRRIIAVGTTTTRTLESLASSEDGTIAATSGETRLFIHPGHRFHLVSGLVTNFHLPRSSLLMLVAAFAGRDLILSAYRDAVAAGYRFYSYGDAMVIL